MKTTNTTPDFKRFTFVKNKQRPDIYDLQGEPDPLLFHYFRLSKPLKPFLKKQGATYVLESWKNGKKTCFTGLKPTIIPNYYLGDIVLKYRGKTAKKSLILIKHEGEIITLYFFPSFTVYPSLRTKFINQFIEYQKNN